MLTEKTDVYSFGILIMEIITGRSLVNYSKRQGERNSSIRTFLKSHLQRLLSFSLLVALKCVDPDATKRPKIRHIIHMLMADKILFRDVCSFPFLNFALYITREQKQDGTEDWRGIVVIPSQLSS
ncbi:hypothetical protein Ahy_B05g077307 [Arachis hypogaea]|uniref:non-specific serine/threonine protein kinase n=1 Tax=Arachis hypogaea TaxID=3818 RepID=A0A444Z4N2_ARAHY|nr:hypothetical protein Ahy_B05g077307 [Arachis hypogaea]